jgi:hypothetical protein
MLTHYMRCIDFVHPLSDPSCDLWFKWPNGWRTYNLLVTSDEAIPPFEIADGLGLHRRTVKRNLERLRTQGLATPDGDGQWLGATRLVWSVEFKMSISAVMRPNDRPGGDGRGRRRLESSCVVPGSEGPAEVPSTGAVLCGPRLSSRSPLDSIAGLGVAL